MKRQLYIGVVLGMMIIGGCGLGSPKKEIVAKVNDFEITKADFEAEFKESSYARVDTVESRKEFLDNLINRKLILQDAQAKGLDKEKRFLRMIEKFWEQSLLKIALDKKTQEIALKKEMTRAKQSEAINEWVADLHKKAHIEVNEDLLKK